MNKFKVKCIKTVIDKGELFFKEGKEYTVTDCEGEWETNSETGNKHVIADKNNKNWFKQNFKKVE